MRLHNGSFSINPGPHRVWSQFLLVIGLVCSAMAQPSSSIQALVNAGNMDGMRWSNFSDYRSWLQKLYEPLGYAPAWVQGTTPSSQALSMIELVRNAWQKGLESEDYDASRWAGSLQALKNPNADVPAFEVGLRVCTMRYISDLRIGRISPPDFQFGLKIDQETYDRHHFR